MTLRLSEIYRSVQGEGPRVGEATIFVRFAGCNLRCPSWPCDTQHAIDPAKYRHEWLHLNPSAIAERISSVGPATDNICFTGGEPFLQNNKDLSLLVEELIDRDFRIQEVFTNGTLLFPDWVKEYLYVVMDWKLPGSGESYQDANRFENFKRLDGQDAIKFTIADRNDYDHAISIWDALRASNSRRIDEVPEIFYGPVWGKIEASELIKWALEDNRQWRLNLQTHNLIWDRTKRGI